MYTVRTIRVSPKGDIISKDAFQGTKREAVNFMKSLFATSDQSFEKATISKIIPGPTYCIHLPSRAVKA